MVDAYKTENMQIVPPKNSLEWIFARKEIADKLWLPSKNRTNHPFICELYDGEKSQEIFKENGDCIILYLWNDAFEVIF